MTALEQWQPQPLERLTPKQVQYIANTEVIPKQLRGNVPAIIATIAKGRALGLDDMHALSAFHWIEGRPTLAAETMVLLARRRGHSITAQTTETSATVKGKRGDNGDEYEVTFTIEDAQRAGLAGKDNWKRHPARMLTWRATSAVCRFLFSDILAGVGFTPDELELSPEDVISEAIGEVRPPADNGGPDDTIDGEAHEDLSEGPHGQTAPVDTAAEATPAGGAEAVSSSDETYTGETPEAQVSFADMVPAAARRGRKPAGEHRDPEGQ